MAKRPKNVPMCYVCRLKPPLGKCLICGFRVRTQDIDPQWKLRHEFLETVFKKLKMHNMVSTDDPATDLEIVRKFGPWHPDLKMVRDQSYRIIGIEYPESYLQQRQTATHAKETNIV